MSTPGGQRRRWMAAYRKGQSDAEERIEALTKALEESYRQIRLLAEAGVERLTDHGVTVDPAERTYQPIIDRIAALAAPTASAS